MYVFLKHHLNSYSSFVHLNFPQLFQLCLSSAPFRSKHSVSLDVPFSTSATKVARFTSKSVGSFVQNLLKFSRKWGQSIKPSTGASEHGSYGTMKVRSLQLAQPPLHYPFHFTLHTICTDGLLWHRICLSHQLMTSVLDIPLLKDFGIFSFSTKLGTDSLGQHFRPWLPDLIPTHTSGGHKAWDRCSHYFSRYCSPFSLTIQLCLSEILPTGSVIRTFPKVKAYPFQECFLASDLAWQLLSSQSHMPRLQGKHLLKVAPCQEHMCFYPYPLHPQGRFCHYPCGVQKGWLGCISSLALASGEPGFKPNSLTQSHDILMSCAADICTFLLYPQRTVSSETFDENGSFSSWFSLMKFLSLHF